MQILFPRWRDAAKAACVSGYLAATHFAPARRCAAGSSSESRYKKGLTCCRASSSASRNFARNVDQFAQSVAEAPFLGEPTVISSDPGSAPQFRAEVRRLSQQALRDATRFGVLAQRRLPLHHRRALVRRADRPSGRTHVRGSNGRA